MSDGTDNARITRPDGLPVGVPFTAENQPEGRGRPKGSRNAKTILNELLDLAEQVKHPVTHEDDEVSNREFILAKLVAMAKSGDLASIDRVLDRTEGKPTQALNLGGQDGENPIESKLTVELVRPKGSSNG